MNIKKLVNDLRKNYDKKVVRKIEDLKNDFQDKKEMKKILKKNPIIYTVYIKKLDKNNMAGLTVMNPGYIGKEFYFTKGHKHKKPFSEIYILIKGKGKLLLQNKKSKVVNLRGYEKIKIPGKSAHRLVNVARKKLEVLTLYNKISGHNYKIKFKKKLFKTKRN